MSQRAKAKIIHVGSFDEDGTPISWAFDGEGRESVIGVHYAADGSLIALGGWTPYELRAFLAADQGEK